MNRICVYAALMLACWAVSAAAQDFLTPRLKEGAELSYRVEWSEFSETTESTVHIVGRIDLMVKEERSDGRFVVDATGSVESSVSSPEKESGRKGCEAELEVQILVDPGIGWHFLNPGVFDGLQGCSARTILYGLELVFPVLPAETALRSCTRPVRWVAANSSYVGALEMLTDPREEGAILMGTTASPQDGFGDPSAVRGRVALEIVRNQVVDGQSVAWLRSRENRLKWKQLLDVTLVDGHQSMR